jgi:hypothetical protein
MEYIQNLSKSNRQTQMDRIADYLSLSTIWVSLIGLAGAVVVYFLKRPIIDTKLKGLSKRIFLPAIMVVLSTLAVLFSLISIHQEKDALNRSQIKVLSVPHNDSNALVVQTKQRDDINKDDLVVQGFIGDYRGAAIPNAKICTIGETVITKSDSLGNFEFVISANRGSDSVIRLTALKQGYVPLTTAFYLGQRVDNVQMILQEQGRSPIKEEIP